MYAYLVVRIDGSKLFIDDSKVTPEVMDYLENVGVELRPYETILSEIERFVGCPDLFTWLSGMFKERFVPRLLGSRIDLVQGTRSGT